MEIRTRRKAQQSSPVRFKSHHSGMEIDLGPDRPGRAAGHFKSHHSGMEMEVIPMLRSVGNALNRTIVGWKL